jgi:methenyltetrahydromethanopterin cyclohydrolase
MAEIITMPRYGATMEEGLLASWLKQEGERVTKGEALCEIETEKLTSELEAPEDGYLRKILRRQGERCVCGEPIAVIAGLEEDIGALLGKAGGAKQREALKISPKAIELAKAEGFDYSSVKGTGIDGTITREDVRKALRVGAGSEAAVVSRPAPEIGINQNAMGSVEGLIARAADLNCRYYRLAQGTHVVDMGVGVIGSWSTARLFTEIDLAGLGSCSFRDFPLTEQISVPCVEVYVDNLELACAASRVSGLKLAANEEDRCFAFTAYRDMSALAVLGLQMESLPDEAFANRAAAECGVNPANLYLLVHPSASIVGSVRVSARIIGQTIDKMALKGFDTSSLVAARGYCAVAPVARDAFRAIGCTNDCLLYGGKSSFWARSSDEEIEAVIGELVTEGAKDYGRLFSELFEEAGRSYCNMDPNIRSPAMVQIFNLNTGMVFTAGQIRKDLLLKSFFGL